MSQVAPLFDLHEFVDRLTPKQQRHLTLVVNSDDELRSAIKREKQKSAVIGSNGTTALRELSGSLPYDGPPLTIEQMNQAIAEAVWAANR